MVERLKTNFCTSMSYKQVYVRVYQLKIDTSSDIIFQFVIQNYERDDMGCWNYIGTDYKDVEKKFMLDLHEFLIDY